ncbi:MAG: proprotein convertase P-domain-containing protein [Anaerolineales bacterium]|nr:proprotein convertase P-domain-containing protein [Anaerolineales bacterium]
MKMKLRSFSTILIGMILTGLFSPTYVRAEKPTPTPTAPPATEATEAPVAGPPPTLIADHLLSVPSPPPGCTSNPLNFSSGVPIPIPDEGVITATLNVSGADAYLWDLDLTTQIQHTYVADLDIYLVSPSGTEVTITTDNGANRDNVFDGTTWDDQWVGPSVGDYVYVNNVVVPFMSPEEAMGAFRGENPNGVWKLVIHDDAQLDVGTLNGWDLQFTTFPTAPVQFTTNEIIWYTNLPIPDEGTLVVPFNFSPQSYTDLSFETTILHPRNADLDVYLVSPGDLVTVTLTTGNGGAFGNGFQGTLWTDKAGTFNPPGAVTDATFEDGITESPLVPENAMSALIGNFSGTWKLVIVDHTSGETGTLTEYGFSIAIASCLPDLGVSQNQSPYPTALDAPIEYAINARNYGTISAHNIWMTDTLPTGMLFQSWTAPPDWTCQTPPVGGTGQITCQTAELAPLSIVTHTLQLKPGDVPQPIPHNIVDLYTTETESDFYSNHSTYEQFVTYFSANGNYWDLQDNLYTWTTNANNDPIDDGALDDGGQDAFDGWGSLRVRILDANDTVLTDDTPLVNFDLAYVGDRWVTHNAPSFDSVAFNREIAVSTANNYLRYLDAFTNNANSVRKISIAWGGDLGSDSSTTLAATSSGNLNLTAADQWAVTIQNNQFNPAGPAGDPPVGYLLHGPGDTSYVGTGAYDNNPFDNAWAGNGNDNLAHVFTFTLQPGETKYLMYYVYRGLAEEQEGPESCTTNCIIPPTGSEIALAQTVLTALAASPDVCDLSASVRANLINWPELNVACSYPVYLPNVVR